MTVSSVKKTTNSAAHLLQILRKATPSGQLGLLSVEVLLHIAGGPLTIEELVQRTTAQNAHVNRAVLKLTPWFDQRNGEVRIPAVHLLQRRRRPQARGYRIHLTRKGREFLALAGIVSPSQEKSV